MRPTETSIGADHGIDTAEDFAQIGYRLSRGTAAMLEEHPRR